MRNWTRRYRRPLVVVLTLAFLLAIVGIIGAQPPIPHAVMEGDDCLSCHQSGAAGAPRVAWDHLGRSNDDCTHCHQVTNLLAQEIPHPIFGRDDCLACHLTGVGSTPRISGNHVDYTNEQCQECHMLSAAAAEATPIPTVTPTQEPAAPAGAAACASCHQLIFADEQHMVFTGQPIGDAEVGAELYAELCARCHGDDGETPVGDNDVVIKAPDYWGTHDDAAILLDIGAGSHGQMTAFAEPYEGPLSWDQILDIVAHVRTWGPFMGPPAGPGAASGPTYETDIGPLLTDRCGACHGGTAGLTVTDYESLMAGSDSGPVILPGDPENSKIVVVQRQEHYAQLTAEELELLIQWIADGAPR
jgi:mono/diheme cytochrome c family protein